MKNILESLMLVILVTLALPSTSFAGQHSGLGGTPPPAPAPAPERSMFESVEQYLQVYYEWIREQVNASAEQQPTR